MRKTSMIALKRKIMLRIKHSINNTSTMSTCLRFIFGFSIILLTLSNYFISFRIVRRINHRYAPTLHEFSTSNKSKSGINTSGSNIVQESNLKLYQSYDDLHANQIETSLQSLKSLEMYGSPLRNTTKYDDNSRKKDLPMNIRNVNDNTMPKILISEQKARTLENMKTDGICPKLDNSTTVSVSLVIHSTVDRLWLMEETCRRWTAPIVLVVYYRHKARNPQPWMRALNWKKVCPQVDIVPLAAVPGEEEWQYPVNKLRNIGLDKVKTTHFLMVDVDFHPSGNLEAAIQSNFLSTSQVYPWNHKVAMVVPAFERLATCKHFKDCQGKKHFIPYSYKEIVECVKIEDCGVFHAVDFLEGHLTTASESWLKGEFYEGNIPRKIQCFTSFKYEPYVVLQKCHGVTPYYDERFYGYGKNKIEYISHLRFLNYSFHVLPEGYLVHYPHPKSKANKAFRRERKYRFREKMDNLYEQFLAALNTTHGIPLLGECKAQPQLSM